MFFGNFSNITSLHHLLYEMTIKLNFANLTSKYSNITSLFHLLYLMTTELTFVDF